MVSYGLVPAIVRLNEISAQSAGWVAVPDCAKPEPRNINFIYLHGRGKDVAGPAEPGQLWRRVEWGADGFLHWLAAVRLDPIAPERLADVLAIQW